MTPRTEKLSSDIRSKWRDINRALDTFTQHMNDYPTAKFSEKQLQDDSLLIISDLKRLAQLVNLGQETTIEKLDVHRIIVRVEKQKSIYANATGKE